MTRDENLLLTLAEECAEVQQSVSKILRFGKSCCNPAVPNMTNELDVLTEYYQLTAVMEMLLDKGVPSQFDELTITKIKAEKKYKVEHYLDVSHCLGRIAD